MPLPEKAKEFVASAVAALSDRKGTIHYLLMYEQRIGSSA